MTDLWLEQFHERRKAREQADRSFDLFDEHLVVKASVAPEVGLRIAKFDIAMAKFVADYQDAQAKGKPLPSSGVTDEEMLALAESVIGDCLEDDSKAAWARLRDPASPNPLDLLEIYGLARFMVGKVAGLPTDAPSGSSAGRLNGQDSSKAKSGSRAATRKR